MTESHEMTKDNFMQGETIKIERLDFEDGKHTFIREMSGGARNAWEEAQMEPVREDGKLVRFEQKLAAFRTNLAVRVICNSKGELLFKPSDAEAFGAKISSTRLEKIVEKAMAVNGISQADQKAMEKNLEQGQKEDLSSD